MFELGSYLITMNSDGIKLPYSENSERPGISSRHKVFISIHKEGYVKVNNRKTEIDSLGSYIKLLKTFDPNLVVSIVADKKCKMGFLMNVLNETRVLPRTSFFFHTTSSKDPIGL